MKTVLVKKTDYKYNSDFNPHYGFSEWYVNINDNENYVKSSRIIVPHWDSNKKYWVLIVPISGVYKSGEKFKVIWDEEQELDKFIENNIPIV